MKKLFLAAFVAVCGLSGVNAQSTGFEAEAYVGLPMGDIKDASSFNFGINAAYYWDVAESFKVGAMLGYDFFSGKEVDGEKQNISFLPIAASGKYFFDQFYVGLDLGYALGLTSEKMSEEIFPGESISAEVKYKGGLMFRPRVGYTTASFDVFAFYKSISNKTEVSASGGGESFSASTSNSVGSLGVGFTYKF